MMRAMTTGMMIRIASLTNVCSRSSFLVCFSDRIALALVVKKVAPLIASKKVNKLARSSLGFAHYNVVF